MDFDKDQFKALVKEYIDDSTDLLDSLDTRLLQLEQVTDPDPPSELIREVLSLLHTYKGNSGLMGFPSIGKYCHKLEDLFKAIESGFLAFDAGAKEAFMLGGSVLRKTVSTISSDEPTDPNLEAEMADLEAVLEQRTAGSASDQKTRAVTSANKLNPFAKKIDTLRVDFQRLDHLLNLVGELVIFRTRLGQLSGQFLEEIGEIPLTNSLTDTSEHIDRVTSNLHDAIMKVRMLPIKQVFSRFQRYVRDISKALGKDVIIKLEGENTELDKTVIDEIGEPLLHLVRNAVDHGIEFPNERLAAGKPEQGNIHIQASQESSHIVVTVEDDGKGIQEDKLIKKAREADLLDDIATGQMELMDLIFLPGMSTTEEVTEISGRGVGLDVVKKSLVKLGGSVDVKSIPNQGTQFIITLPLTLAIISALMVGVSGETYAVPLLTVQESKKLNKDSIHVVNHREVIKIRDQVLPLTRLSNIFNLPRTESDDFFVVVVQSSVGKIGLVVDSLVGQQEIVIKALDEYIGNAPGVAGSTILGDGSVVLIVDIPAVILTAKQIGNTEDMGV